MIQKTNILFLAFFLLITNLACTNKQYTKTTNGIKTTIQQQNVEISFYTPNMVRVLKWPEKNDFTKESLSVVKKAEKVKFSVVEANNTLRIKSDALHLILDLQTGEINFSDSNNNNLFVDKAYGTSFKPRKDGENDSYTVRQSFVLSKDEVIYGLGQQQTGKMNQRNQELFLRQENMKICIPFIQSEKGYGLFWDNYSPTLFSDTPEEMFFESTGLCSDYYFMYGENADGVIAHMRDLTGQAPMFPLWTYGFWQSRERYTSQDELVNTVKTYRGLQIPLDGIIQDWQYWSTDNKHWNSTEFGNPSFPEPEKMVADVHALNAHIAISVWPSFGPETKIYKEFEAKNILLNFETYPQHFGVRMYDAFNPEARDIYWENLNKNIFSLGMDGWWLDATEPEHSFVKDADFDQETYLGTLRSVYNAFPLMSVGGVYEHQRQFSQDKRVFILTRSAFAGQQRYGANSWSGDVDANWESLRKQIPAALNFSLCAIPYWNSDIGGFFVRDYEGNLKNKAYHELYVRWMQFGTFTTMMRSHGTNLPREIFQFGSAGDWAFDVQEKYINLRYRLLPYLYSTAWETTNNSGSFMRALFMDFNHDKKVHDIADEYLFGRSLLVAPVTESMYVENKGEKSIADFGQVKSREVYLPEGADWYDFWTNEKLDGGQNIEKETPIDIIPLYIKAGTILPMGPDVQYATEKKWDSLDVLVYPGNDAEFVLYEDELDNYNYEKGAYSTIKMVWNEQRQSLNIGTREGKFQGMLEKRNFNILLLKNGCVELVENVLYEGKEISITF